MRKIGIRVKAFGVALFLLATPVAGHANPSEAQTFSAEEVSADIEEWIAWTRATHPDLSYSVDEEELANAVTALIGSLPANLSRAEAWRKMARLNPILNDGHTGLVIPSREARDAPDPAILVEADRHELRLYSGSQDTAPALRIAAINGIAWSTLAERTLPLLRGESEALRLRILNLKLRDALSIMLPEGQIENVSIVGQDGGAITFPLDPDRLEFAARDSMKYQLELGDEQAVLTVPSFRREREEEFSTFLESAFAQIANSGVKTLIIDVSKNGGGARQLSDRLMGYLTDKPYSSTSAVTARVMAENQSLIPGSELGSVVTVPFAMTVTPSPELENRFSGDVTIRVGPESYSAAVVFAATAQDAGVARVVGTPPDTPANQTGQTQTHTLANTGFDVRSPIYIFYRASGDRSRRPLATD